MSKLSHFQHTQREARSEQRANMHRAVRKQMLLHLPDVKAAFDLLPPALRKHAFFSVDFSVVTVGATLRKLRSFKDRRLVRLLAKIDAAGFTAEHTRDWPNEKEPEREYSFFRVLGDDAMSTLDSLLPKATREYFASHYTYGLRDPLMVRITVYAYVAEDSATCRSVVVRTERREFVDVIREIVCS